MAIPYLDNLHYVLKLIFLERNGRKKKLGSIPSFNTHLVIIRAISTCIHTLKQGSSNCYAYVQVAIVTNKHGMKHTKRGSVTVMRIPARPEFWRLLCLRVVGHCYEHTWNKQIDRSSVAVFSYLCAIEVDKTRGMLRFQPLLCLRAGGNCYEHTYEHT